MSKEMMSAVHAGEKPKLRDRISPRNKARLGRAGEIANDVQSVIAVPVGIGAAVAAGSIAPAVLAGGYILWNQAEKRIVWRRLREKNEGKAHQVHQLPPKRTLFRASDRAAA